MTYVSPPPPHPLGQHRPAIQRELDRRGLDWSGRKVQRQPPPEAEAEQPGGEEDQDYSEGD
ncbi:hypothetical protein SAMN04488103_102443 [Gemmobacter aquatilis]|uniref:Uncharacterized protein n=1 Tax=Gemmobacter aquatilis TaxID=933059 RepID=A0A1H8CA50_9RHOB|nr:hypothetical protein SAMN04488103_102443 [Gemmobacter aquatilis]